MEKMIALYNDKLCAARVLGYTCTKCSTYRREIHLSEGVPTDSFPVKVTTDILYIVRPYCSKSGKTWTEPGNLLDSAVIYLHHEKFTGKVAIVPKGGTIAACPEILRPMSRYARWYSLETIHDKSPFPGFCKDETNLCILADNISFIRVEYEKSICNPCLDKITEEGEEREYTHEDTLYRVAYTKNVDEGIVNRLRKEKYHLPHEQWPVWAEAVLDANEVYKMDCYYLVIGDDAYVVKELSPVPVSVSSP